MKNEYRIEGDLCYIKLTRGQECVIDVKDMDLIKDCKWCAQHLGIWYASTSGWKIGKRHQLMHRVIIGALLKEEVDHIDRDGLNNSMGNLRITDRSTNCLNQASRPNSASKYLGVYRHGSKWQASVTVKGKKITVGSFVDEREAGIARAKSFVSHLGPEINPEQTKLSKESVGVSF